MFDLARETRDGVRDLMAEVKAVDTERLRLEEVARDLEVRLRSLEAWKNAVPAALVIALLSAVVALVDKL